MVSTRLTDEQVRALAWNSRPTPIEAVGLLRSYARSRRLPPGDNNFDDAANIIVQLGAEVMAARALTPSPQGEPGAAEGVDRG